MEAFATYLFRSSVWLTGFALVYALFLRNERFFKLNRFFLILGIGASILFPFFTWHYTVIFPVVPSVEVTEPIYSGAISPESEPFQTGYILLLIYTIGILYLIFRLFKQTLSVWMIIRKSEPLHFNSAKLIHTDRYPASFSFFSFVFVNPSIDETETNEIVNHEQEHIRQRHWIDLMLFEILCTIQWFNPAIWFYGRFIRQNHEYLADEAALQRTSNPAIYRAALLNQMFGGPVISLANSFNYSINKKRFTMMKHTIKSPFRKLKLLLVLPLIVGVFYAFAAPEYQFVYGADNQNKKNTPYFISKDKIDIPFVNQYDKNDLEIIKSNLEEVGLTIDYTSLKYTSEGKLSQISASIKRSDGGTVSFTSGDLTPANYPRFKMDLDGSFGIYFPKTVTGKVTDDKGEALPGASVVVSGKPIGTQTDVNGNFKLELTDDSPIVISFVGYNSQKLTPDFSREIVIKMKPVVIAIEETGNATFLSDVKKESSIIKTTTEKEEIKLQDDSPFKFRSSVGSDKQPMVVIDGIVTEGKNIDNFSPETIESINVLKGEQAIKNYGSRGENGVIEITTKNHLSTSNNNLLNQRKDESLIINSLNGPNAPIFFIDSKITDHQTLKDLSPQNIESINVLKGNDAIKLYGNKAKNGVVLITTKEKIETFTIVEEMPEFPGGIEGLKEYVAATLQYPAIALENRIRGQVLVNFVIDKDGSVKDIKLARGIDPSLDKEALRIVNSLPKWKPGTQAGKAVSVAYSMPINFNLPAESYQPYNGTLKVTTNTKTTYTKSRPDAKIIGNINWLNNTVYTSGELNKTFGLKKGDKYTKEQLQGIISGPVSSLYLDKGYVFSKIDIAETPMGDGNNNLTFTVYEGIRGKVGRIDVKGNKNVSSEDILRKIKIKPGDLFSKTKIIQSIEAINKMGKFNSEEIRPEIIPDSNNSNQEFGTVNIIFNVTEK